jgi:hypothetical protein
MTLHHLKPGRMNSSKLFAFVLIALGIIACAYHSLPGMSGEKGVANLPAAAEKTAVVNPATIAGALALAGGIVVLVIDRKEPAA